MSGDGGARVERLRAAVAGRERLLVLTHDNPDPDAIGSAFALRHLLSEIAGAGADVGFGGVIGRAENRAMVRLLQLEAIPLSTLEPDEYDGVLLVDTQPGTGNNSLPATPELVAVIDHHPSPTPIEAAFVDIRPEVGATATIVLEYFRAAGAPLPTRLATALFYALKSETQDLGREATGLDRRAYLELLPQADMGTVARIQRARVPREYFRAYRVAIERAQLYAGVAVVTDLGIVASPDMVAEIADFLLRLQGADWSCCVGRHQNTLAVSLRTSDPEAHAGRIIRSVMAGIGTAGGHGTMAGGQAVVREGEYEQLNERVVAALLAELGLAEVAPEPLVSPSS